MSVKCDSCGHEHSNWVPRDRLNSQGASLGAKVEAAEQKLSAAQEKLAELQAQVDAAPDVAALQRKLERAAKRADEAEERYAAESAEWRTREVFLAAGLTDADDRELVLFRYGKLPEQGRPDLATYLDKGAREDRYLRHLFGSGDSSEQGTDDPGTTAAGAPKARALPNMNKGVQPRSSGDTLNPRSVAALPYTKEARGGDTHRAIMDSFKR